MAEPKKIVYLLGAGATHAEYMNLYPTKVTDGNFLFHNSLLMADVSARTCQSAQQKKRFPKKIEVLLSPAGLSNIELFISLIESNVSNSEKIITKLKKILESDITDRLTESRLKRFYLHKSLLEYHEKYKSKEKLLGVISLNYDEVIDQAFMAMTQKPDYSLGSESESEKDKVLLLKLHGGFNLTTKNGSRIPIITPGINKNYLQLPYNFIWGRALEILIDCDILRIIGCSLSQNDVGLVDLLFKAHLSRTMRHPFEVQMITFDPHNNPIKKNYGFLPNIKTATEIEGGIITDASITIPDSGANPFRIWLKEKIKKAVLTEKILTKKEISRTKFIRKLGKIV
jgi:hypothetical protein